MRVVAKAIYTIRSKLIIALAGRASVLINVDQHGGELTMTGPFCVIRGGRFRAPM
jgi:hypothetical protein